MIVWLASYPRSGNTFIRLLLHHYFDVATYDRYVPQIEMPDPRERGHLANLVGFQPFSSLKELDEQQDPTFVKTHELPDDERPAIYVIRDGRDSITSYAHFILTVEEKCAREGYKERFERTIESLVTDKDRYGGWGAHVVAWTQRPAPTAIVHYSQLQKRPVATLRRALSQLSLDLMVKREKYRENFVRFGDLQRISSELFRKGESGNYVDEMPGRTEEKFWERYGEVMQRFGYRRRNYWGSIKNFWRPGTSRRIVINP